MRAKPGSPPGEYSPASESVPVARAVCLVGFMGAGKSSVGRALSQQLAWPFVDLDERIQTREKRTIEEIFRQSGEAEFRRVEHTALRELLMEIGSSPAVMALGGGAFVQSENAALLEKAGIRSVFLDASVDELFRRCQEQSVDRPLRRDQNQFRQLHEARRPGYLAAVLRIETGGKDVETVAAEVANRMELR
jgi:shikimate kinase